MTQEKSPDQSEYTGRVLPGSRWLQRAFAGHTEQIVTVLRVGTRSVMLVVEGNPNGLSGHDRQKVGQRFNVVLETFLKTHTLLEQPKGYRPGDENIPVTVRKDTVETYFRRRRYADEWIGTMEGRDTRQLVTDPKLPIVHQPIYQGDAVLPPLNPNPQPEDPLVMLITPQMPTPPPEEEPEPMQEPTVITATDEQLLSDLREIEAEQAEPDPVQMFIDTGHAAVAKLTEELVRVGEERDHHQAMANGMDAKWKRLKVSRDRIEDAVLAAMSAAEGSTEEPAPEELGTEPLPEAPVRLPEGPRHGPVAATSGTQRSWVLDRLAKDGRIHVGSVADEFASTFNLTRGAAIKNLASILGDQVNRPNPQWPTAMRVGKGDYSVLLNG